jgi:hypothetical protein
VVRWAAEHELLITDVRQLTYRERRNASYVQFRVMDRKGNKFDCTLRRTLGTRAVRYEERWVVEQHALEN